LPLLPSIILGFNGFFIGVFMPLALRSRFRVGVYDPAVHDSWPYFHQDEGRYLSKKKHLCSHISAVEFDHPHEAREFYFSWKQAHRYRLHVDEFKTHVDVPEPVFPADHPRSILKSICKNESSYVISTAYTWFSGDTNFTVSEPTLAKHRKILLPYGIDISLKPVLLLEPFPDLDDHVWHLSKPVLSMA
jgi:hypothetical protein